MPKTVDFLFDFGSPNAYLSHKVIPQIEARTGAKFVYVPILLGGLFKAANNRSPMEAFADIPNKLAYERVERERFVKRHGIQIHHQDTDAVQHDTEIEKQKNIVARTKPVGSNCLL